MTGTITDGAISTLGRALTPLSTSTALALATELGIHQESLARQWVDLWWRPAEAITGFRSTASRRRESERRAVDALTADSIRPGVRRPKVNWHSGGTGPTLLLLNGWTAGGLVWPSGWVRRLEADYRVIRIDNRGTGWSRTAPQPFTIADLADDAHRVLQAIGVDRAVVLGLSMGGMIAQELALRHPEVIDALLLVGTRPPTPAQIPPSDEMSMSLLRTPKQDENLRDFMRDTWSGMTGPNFADREPAIIEELVAQILERVTPRSGMLYQARAMWSWHGPQRLGRITVPTTVVHGDRDPLVPVGNGMRLARLIPHAKYVELPGVGHLVPQEAGDRLAELLADHAAAVRQ